MGRRAEAPPRHGRRRDIGGEGNTKASRRGGSDGPCCAALCCAGKEGVGWGHVKEQERWRSLFCPSRGRALVPVVFGGRPEEEQGHDRPTGSRGWRARRGARIPDFVKSSALYTTRRGVPGFVRVGGWRHASAGKGQTKAKANTKERNNGRRQKQQRRVCGEMIRWCAWGRFVCFSLGLACLCCLVSSRLVSLALVPTNSIKMSGHLAHKSCCSLSPPCSPSVGPSRYPFRFSSCWCYFVCAPCPSPKRQKGEKARGSYCIL